MRHEDAHPENEPSGSPVRKRGKQVTQPVKELPARKKTRHPVMRPGCILINGQGSCPEWEEYLVNYPLIDSVQREDFPEQGASFAYLAHFYRTPALAGECSLVKKEFRKFFREIGYAYDNSGDYESRWFEGVGVKVW